MHSGKRFIAIGLAVLSGGGLAACGDDDAQTTTTAARLSKAAYTAKLAAIGKDQDRVHADVEKAFRAKTVAEIKTRLSAFADAEDAMGRTVAAIVPPADAATANAQLAAGARELAGQIRATVATLDEAATPAAALKAVDARLGKASGAAKLDAALSKLNRLGYTKSG